MQAQSSIPFNMGRFLSNLGNQYTIVKSACSFGRRYLAAHQFFEAAMGGGHIMHKKKIIFPCDIQYMKHAKSLTIFVIFSFCP